MVAKEQLPESVKNAKEKVDGAIAWVTGKDKYGTCLAIDRQHVHLLPDSHSEIPAFVQLLCVTSKHASWWWPVQRTRRVQRRQARSRRRQSIISSRVMGKAHSRRTARRRSRSQETSQQHPSHDVQFIVNSCIRL